MESFGSKRSSAAVNLDGSETGEVKQRLGARVRAFGEFLSLLNHAEENSLSFEEVRELLPGLQEGTWNPAGTNEEDGTSGKVKSRSYLLQTPSNKLILQSYSGDSNDLKELCSHAWVFKNKKTAKAAAENNDLSSGVQVF